MQRWQNSNNRSPKRSRGLERACQHIKEARALSAELGGTDKDVKQYFFGLSPGELAPILDAYEGQHGRTARDYAEETLPRWRSGQRTMSGLVAARLFSLLPGFMPRKTKFDLVKSLWEAKCPSSHKTFYVGADADEQELVALVRQHLQDVVQKYVVPDSISQRFKWLAQDDARLHQELQNHFLQLNREVLSVASDKRLPRMLATMRAGESVQTITQTIRVGNHQLDLVFDPAASGVSTQAPKQPGTSGCLLVAVVVVILLAASLGSFVVFV